MYVPSMCIFGFWAETTILIIFWAQGSDEFFSGISCPNVCVEDAKLISEKFRPHVEKSEAGHELWIDLSQKMHKNDEKLNISQEEKLIQEEYDNATKVRGLIFQDLQREFSHFSKIKNSTKFIKCFVDF